MWKLVSVVSYGRVCLGLFVAVAVEPAGSTSVPRQHDHHVHYDDRHGCLGFHHRRWPVGQNTGTIAVRAQRLQC